MKYLKVFKIFENTITKNELVDKITFYSNCVYAYINDVNLYKNANLNLRFHYDTSLGMNEILKLGSSLDYNSSDGLITAVCQEFIVWSEYFTEGRCDDRYRRDLENFVFNYEYLNLSNEYKSQNRYTLYNRDYNHMVYIYVGQKIKSIISGTIWDIPEKKKFEHDDKTFILDSLISEFDVSEEYLEKASDMIDVHLSQENNDGIIIRLPIIGNHFKYIKLSDDNDFIYRLNSYFKCVVLLKSPYHFTHGYNYKIWIPFYK